MSRTNLFRTELRETDDSGELQLGTGYGYAGEEVSGVHVVRQHGFASHAPKGSHGIGLAGSGERALVAFLGQEHQDHRPRGLNEGNATLYDAGGNQIRMLGKDGIWQDAGERKHKTTAKSLEHTAKDTAAFGGQKKTYLGGDGKDGQYAAVMTVSGPSKTVFAKL